MKKLQSKKTKKEEVKKTSPVDEKEQKFNFGGLPQRDLKKNLGCG